MQTKLTLRLEGALIDAAKRYAAQRGVSVSQLVADYFEALTGKAEDTDEGGWRGALSPSTREMVGIARPTSGERVGTKEDYYRHLEAKHSQHLSDGHG